VEETEVELMTSNQTERQLATEWRGKSKVNERNDLGENYFLRLGSSQIAELGVKNQ
jgi:hypothetical protein